MKGLMKVAWSCVKNGDDRISKRVYMLESVQVLDQ